MEDLAVSSDGISAPTGRARALGIGTWDAGHLRVGKNRGERHGVPLRTSRIGRVFDVVGLTTPREAQYWVAGAGSRFEHYEQLDRADLPTHFIVYPGWMAWHARKCLGRSAHSTQRDWSNHPRRCDEGRLRRAPRSVALRQTNPQQPRAPSSTAWTSRTWKANATTTTRSWTPASAFNRVFSDGSLTPSRRRTRVPARKRALSAEGERWRPADRTPSQRGAHRDRGPGGGSGPGQHQPRRRLALGRGDPGASETVALSGRADVELTATEQGAIFQRFHYGSLGPARELVAASSQIGGTGPVSDLGFGRAPS